MEERKTPLPVGKLDSRLLEKLVFEQLKFHREDVKERPGIGLDCGVLNCGEYDCIVSSDPISAAESEIGRLAVNINCNDIATSGVRPVAMTLVLMLPVGTTGEDVLRIMKQSGEEAAKLEVEIIGGHTEITDTVRRPVAVATCFGKRPAGSSSVSMEIEVGDKILMTKKAGIEGTGIICSDKGKALDFLTADELERGKNFLDEISVVEEGVIAGEIGVKVMHDITEGGVLGAVWEMAQISDMGVRIYGNKIPVDDVTVKIAEHFHIDYLRLISSGSMLIIADPHKAEELIDACSGEGIEISEIGDVTDSAEGLKLYINRNEGTIAPPLSDELYKVLGD